MIENEGSKKSINRASIGYKDNPDKIIVIKIGKERNTLLSRLNFLLNIKEKRIRKMKNIPKHSALVLSKLNNSPNLINSLIGCLKSKNP